MKIAACWIVKNEEKVLGRSLQSLRGAVDELVVVDTGSSDGTVAVAEQHGARVLAFEWVHDFSAAKNHALRATDADIVFFMDADEYFSPALTGKERDFVVQTFQDNPHLNFLAVHFRHLDTDTQLVIWEEYIARIFKTEGGLHYVNPIHEVTAYRDGRASVGADVDLPVVHTGYSGGGMAGKLQRNIELLEASLADESAGELQRSMAAAYLVREYNVAGETGRALEMVRRVMGDAKFFAGIAAYSSLVQDVAVGAISVGQREREKVSRRELYQNIVRRAQKANAADATMPLLDLYYQHAFEVGEDRFLRDANSILPKDISGIDQKGAANYFSMAKEPYLWAAEAAWRRGDLAAAFSFVSTMMMGVQDALETDALAILMGCLKGQPEADQILYLDAVFGTANRKKMQSLMNVLVLEGGTLFLYYFKRMLEKGWALNGDYFYVQLMQQKYDALLQMLDEGREEISADIRGTYYLLAGICAGRPDVLQAQGEELGVYGEVLEAYFAKTALTRPGVPHLEVLRNAYTLLASLDFAKAEEFRRLFSVEAGQIFLRKAGYCIPRMLWEEIAWEPLGTLADQPAYASPKAYCLNRMGKHRQALDVLLACEAKGRQDREWFNNLLVVAEQADYETANEARWVYEANLFRMNEMTDMDDVAKTGAVYDDSPKKRKKQLQEMGYRRLMEEIREERQEHPVEDEAWWEVLSAAARVYEGKNMPMMAQRCYVRMATAGFRQAETLGRLAAVFTRLGNPVLGDRLKKEAGA